MTYPVLYRLGLSYTCLNLFLLVLSYGIPCLKTIASANTVLVAVAITVSLGLISFPVLTQYYRSLFPFLTWEGAIALHFLVHYLPLLWVDACFGLESACVALVCLWIWYGLVRNRIQSIYTRRLSVQTYLTILLSSSCVFLWIATVFTLCFCGRV